MAHDGNPVLVDLLGRAEIIDGSLQPRGPGGDRAPIVGSRLFALLPEMRLDAFANIGPVGIDVAAVKRRDRIAAVDALFDSPDIDLGTSALIGRPVILDAGNMAIDPGRRQCNRAVL